MSSITIAIIEPIRQSKLNWFASAGKRGKGREAKKFPHFFEELANWKQEIQLVDEKPTGSLVDEVQHIAWGHANTAPVEGFCQAMIPRHSSFQNPVNPQLNGLVVLNS